MLQHKECEEQVDRAQLRKVLDATQLPQLNIGDAVAGEMLARKLEVPRRHVERGQTIYLRREPTRQATDAAAEFDAVCVRRDREPSSV